MFVPGAACRHGANTGAHSQQPTNRNGALMGRPTKLTTEIQEQIVTRLKAGATIKATCDSVGIHVDTYQNWIKRGNKARNGMYFSFFDEATRARSDGLIHAAISFRAGMNPSKTVTEHTETVTETRLRTIKNEDGSTEQVPYQHIKETNKDIITNHPGDWRAAMEYLARRDPDEWARQKIQIDVEIKLIVEVVAAIESLGQNPSDVFERIIQRAAQSVDS